MKQVEVTLSRGRLCSGGGLTADANGGIIKVIPNAGPRGLRETPLSTNCFECIGFDRTGSMLSAADSRGNVYAINLSKNFFHRIGKVNSADPQTNEKAPPTCLAFSPAAGGSLEVLVAAGDCSIRSFNVASGDSMATLRGHIRPIRSLDCPSFSLQAVSVSGDATILWDLSTYSKAKEVRGGRSDMIACKTCRSKKEEKVLSVNDIGELYIWAFPSLERLAKLRIWRGRAYAGSVGSMAVSQDGAVAFVVDAECRLCICDLNKAKLLRILSFGGSNDAVVLGICDLPAPALWYGADVAVAVDATPREGPRHPEKGDQGGSRETVVLFLNRRGEVRGAVQLPVAPSGLYGTASRLCASARGHLSFIGRDGSVSVVSHSAAAFVSASMEANEARYAVLALLNRWRSSVKSSPFKGDFSVGEAPEGGSDARGLQPETARATKTVGSPKADQQRHSAAIEGDLPIPRAVWSETEGRYVSLDQRPDIAPSGKSSKKGGEKLDDEHEEKTLQGGVTLSKAKLRDLVHGHGSIPAKYRYIAWPFLLDLPDNERAFEALKERALSDTERGGAPRGKVDVIARSLAEWSPVLEEACSCSGGGEPEEKRERKAGAAGKTGGCDYLKGISSAVAAVLKGAPTAVLFEAAASLFLHWGDAFFENFPHPPLALLSAVERALQQEDAELYAHLLQLYERDRESWADDSLSFNGPHVGGAAAAVWPLMRSFFIPALPLEGWASVMDLLFIERSQPTLFLAVGVELLLRSRAHILRCKSLKSVVEGLKTPLAFDGPSIAKKALALHRRRKVIFEQVSGRQWTSLPPSGAYPILTKYPRFSVDMRKRERERMIEIEKEYLQRRMILDKTKELGRSNYEKAKQAASSLELLIEAEAKRASDLAQADVEARERMRRLEQDFVVERLRQIEEREESVATLRNRQVKLVDSEMRRFDEDMGRRRELLKEDEERRRELLRVEIAEADALKRALEAELDAQALAMRKARQVAIDTKLDDIERREKDTKERWKIEEEERRAERLKHTEVVRKEALEAQEGFLMSKAMKELRALAGDSLLLLRKEERERIVRQIAEETVWASSEAARKRRETERTWEAETEREAEKLAERERRWAEAVAKSVKGEIDAVRQKHAEEAAKTAETLAEAERERRKQLERDYIESGREKEEMDVEKTTAAVRGVLGQWEDVAAEEGAIRRALKENREVFQHLSRDLDQRWEARRENVANAVNDVLKQSTKQEEEISEREELPKVPEERKEEHMGFEGDRRRWEENWSDIRDRVRRDIYGGRKEREGAVVLERERSEEEENAESNWREANTKFFSTSTAPQPVFGASTIEALEADARAMAQQIQETLRKKQKESLEEMARASERSPASSEIEGEALERAKEETRLREDVYRSHQRAEEGWTEQHRGRERIRSSEREQGRRRETFSRETGKAGVYGGRGTVERREALGRTSLPRRPDEGAGSRRRDFGYVVEQRKGRERAGSGRARTSEIGRRRAESGSEEVGSAMEAAEVEEAAREDLSEMLYDASLALRRTEARIAQAQKAVKTPKEHLEYTSSSSALPTPREASARTSTSNIHYERFGSDRESRSERRRRGEEEMEMEMYRTRSSEAEEDIELEPYKSSERQRESGGRDSETARFAEEDVGAESELSISPLPIEPHFSRLEASEENERLGPAVASEEDEE